MRDLSISEMLKLTREEAYRKGVEDAAKVAESASREWKLSSEFESTTGRLCDLAASQACASLAITIRNLVDKQ